MKSISLGGLGASTIALTMILSNAFVLIDDWHRTSLSDDDSSYDKPHSRSMLSSSVSRPWYSDPQIQRDRSLMTQSPQVMVENLGLNTTKFILVSKRGILHKSSPSDSNGEPRVQAQYLSMRELEQHLNSTPGLYERPMDSSSLGEDHDDATTFLMAWVGKYQESDYWLCYLEDYTELPVDAPSMIQPLREFGDRVSTNSRMPLFSPRPMVWWNSTRRIPIAASADPERS